MITNFLSSEGGLKSGGTISGDVTISGDLTVNGNGAGNYDEIINGTVDISIAGSLDNQEYTGLRLKYDDSTGASDGSGVSLDWTWQDNATTETTIGKISTVRNNGDNHGAMKFYTANAGTNTLRMTIDDTGGFTLSGVKITTEGTNQRLKFHGSGDNYILTGCYDDNGWGYFNSYNNANGIQFYTGAGSFYFNNGNVGIGVDSPYNLLHLRKSAVSGSDSHDDDLLVIEETGDHCNINMISDTGSYLMWSDATRNVANVNYQHATGVMGFTAETNFSFNGGAVGIEVTPETDYRSDVTALQVGAGGNIFARQDSGETKIFFSENVKWTSDGFEYINNGSAGYIGLDGGTQTFAVAGSGTADAVASFTTAMILDANSVISLSNNDGNTSNTIFGYNAWQQSANVGADYNTIFGQEAMGSGNISSAERNTGIGMAVMRSITTGDSNVAVGSDALYSLTTASDNIAIGRSTMGSTTTGGANTAVGHYALNGDTDGDGADNTAIGHKALHDAISPSKNVAIGDSAMRVMNGTANGIANCVVIGANAFYGNADNTTIDTNGTIAIGYQSLKSLTTGGGNTAIGYESQLYQTDGASNTTLGYKAFRNADNGESLNTVIGMQAGQFQNHASSDGNVIVGAEACVGGTGNRASSVAIGYRAWGNGGVQNNIGGAENVFIGSESGGGEWQTGASDGNTAVGWNTMKGNMNQATINTAVGKNALLALTQGDYNTIVGGDSGKSINTGSHNATLGADALADGTDAEGNVAVGSSAMYNSVSADNCVAVGRQAIGVGNNTEGGTIAVGYQSLKELTSGSKNIAIGFQSMSLMQTGTNNIALGYHSMDALQGGDGSGGIAASANAGNHNIAIGTDAMGSVEGYRSTTEIDGNIAIGTNALLGGDLLNNNIDFVGNIAIGYNAVDATGNAQGMTGTIGIGYETLTALTSGTQNTAIGFQSMAETTQGDYNTTLGYNTMYRDAGLANTHNTFIGANTGSGDWTGTACTLNTGVGSGVMQGAMNGATNNTAVGVDGLNAVTTGDNNTAIGVFSLSGVTTGVQNVGVGALAGNLIQSGSNNVCIGRDADVSAENASNQIVIGQGATGGGDNSVVLGNSSVTAVLCAADGEAQVYASAIRFPATQVDNANSNALDDYEEGDWTPVISDGTNNATMHGAIGGRYTKVGNKVTVTAYILVTSLGSVSGAIRVTGLPFAVADNNRNYSAFAVSSGEGLNITAGHSVNLTAWKNTQYAKVWLWDSATGGSEMTGAELSADGGFMISGSYLTT